MAGLVPAIHVGPLSRCTTWMPGTSPIGAEITMDVPARPLPVPPPQAGEGTKRRSRCRFRFRRGARYPGSVPCHENVEEKHCDSNHMVFGAPSPHPPPARGGGDLKGSVPPPLAGGGQGEGCHRSGVRWLSPARALWHAHIQAGIATADAPPPNPPPQAGEGGWKPSPACGGGLGGGRAAAPSSPPRHRHGHVEMCACHSARAGEGASALLKRLILAPMGTSPGMTVRERREPSVKVRA